MKADTGMIEDDIDYEPVDFQSDSNDEFQCSKKKLFQFNDIEYTLCLIKPSAMKYKRDIVQRIKEEKFTIIRCCQYKFTPETASEFYSEHYGKTWFPKVVLKMCLGTVFVMCIAKDGAIEKLRTLVGPPRVSEARRKFPLSLRALYGLSGDMATNGLHASSSMEKARSEIYFFFKGIRYLPNQDVESYLDFIKTHLTPLLNKALLEMFKIKPGDPLEWLSEWLLNNNFVKPKLPLEVMKLPSIY